MLDQSTPTPAASGLHGRLLAAAAALVVALTLATGVAATRWIDQPFPGFFVLANRVVPSVGLPSWEGLREGTLYQRTIVAVDGTPVDDAQAVYDHVARQPIGAAAAWLSVALAVPYLLLLDHPASYSSLHGACETYLGLAGFGLCARLIFEAARKSADAMPFAHPAVAGALLGLGTPALVMMLSGVGGGALPVNVLTATAFLFPIGLGTGLLRETRSARGFTSGRTAPASAP